MNVRMRVATIIGIIGMAVGGLTVAAAEGKDPLEVAPAVYTKKFENERVRVLEGHFKAGDSIAMHSHPDHFAYILGPGTLRLTYPDGRTQDVTAKAGEVIWIPAESHASQNVGQTEVHLLVIELKDTPKA